MDENNFIGYEYRAVSVQEEMVSVYNDGYANFGWQAEGEGKASTAGGKVDLKFKRDRKIRNKAELTRLQRQFDACCDEIVSLERSKTSSASIAALTVGMIGCAFLAGSVFAVTATPSNVVLCAILGVPGLVGWALPYFLFQSLRLKKTAAVNPLIEKKYDEIYDVCERGSHLLDK